MARPTAATASTELTEFADYSLLDFGPLRVWVPPRACVRMSAPDEVYSDAVFFDFPSGTIRLSVLAVPRGRQLWPGRAEEIATSQAGIGAQVRCVWDQWGPELHIVDHGERNWVIGLDGSRWMLLGRATWMTDSGWELVDIMRSMIRHTVVDRGRQPLPVRAPLPLRRPDASAEEDHHSLHASPYTAIVPLMRPWIDERAE